MKKSWMILSLIVLAGLGVGAIFLLTWDIPAPQERVERTLPDDRFPN